MNKIRLYEHFPKCPYCRCQTEYHTRIHKACYPSRQIAQQQASSLERTATCKLYVYRCPRQNNIYHLSKSSHFISVQFIPLGPNLRDYRMRPEDETFHIDAKKIKEASKKPSSAITNFEKLQNIAGEIVINRDV